MISTNELRRGNLIYGVSDRVEEVVGLTENTITTKTPLLDDNFTGEAKYFSTIPLTEEWLENFGFEQGGYDFLFWYKDDLEFAGINWADKDTPEYQFLNFHASDDKIIQIHFVNQLQNLIYANTGKELTLNNI